MKAKVLSQKLSAYILPALLGAVICFSVVYALYRPYALLYAAIFLIEELALFSFFDRIKSKKLGGLIYVGLLILVNISAVALLMSAYSSGTEVYFLTWFYGNEGSYTNVPDYLNAVFLAGGFFVLSILYYFTQIRYRSLGVMLSILFPFVIYAKRADEFPELAVTLIITLFLAVMVHNRRIDPAQPETVRGRLVLNRAYFIGLALFVSITGAIVMMIDKPTYFSQLEKNANYFDYVQSNATGAGDYEGMSETSSQRYGGNSYSNTPIFYFETDGDQNIYFLRRQAYDTFNGDVWEVSEDGYYRAYSAEYPEYMADDILSDMSVIFSDTDASPSQSLILKANGRVYDDSFNSVYLPAPLGTIMDEKSRDEARQGSDWIAKYSTGEIFRANDSGDGMDVSFEFLEQTDKFKSYAATLGLTYEEYENELNGEYTDDKLTASTNLLNDYMSAKYDYSDTEGVSDRLAQLAAEITADCDSEYEKALALENYFEENGYVYNLDYVPDDTSIDYFVFEGKTGVCSSYATAMTLMARSLGMPSRYVEGFAAFEKTDNGDFVIRDSQAHAFVEVYIPGAGWMTFDPTVSGYQTITEESGFSVSTFITILGRFLVVIIVVFVIIFMLLLDRILEMFFRIRLKFKTPAERTRALYRNVVKLIGFSEKGDYSTYTVKMLKVYLKQSRNVTLEQMFNLFERTAYGGYAPTANEFNSVYVEYKQNYKYLRRVKKRA